MGLPENNTSVRPSVHLAPAATHPVSTSEDRTVALELDALGLEGDRAETFVKGRAAGVQAARRHGPVPDHVADAIATIIAADPSVRAAG